MNVRQAPAPLSLYLSPVNAIGKPCCARIASWQLEAPLSPTSNRSTASIDKPISDPYLSAVGMLRRVALGPSIKSL